MLSLNDMRKVAARSGARDIANVEIDIILTHLLELFTERGIMDHLAFKGGTMLRKMIFGPRGRLSTDLDFTCRTDINNDDLMLMMLDALGKDYRGLFFRIDDREWYQTEDGCAVNPVCAHAENKIGQKIKVQVSTRERPVMPVVPVPQKEQEYFKLLDFQPSAIPSISFEEAVAEKVRAASQRSKIRDLHDLAEIISQEPDRERVRKLAVLKLWNSGGPGLNYVRFRDRITGAADYDVADLASLLRKDQKPDVPALIDRVIANYRYLENLTDLEAILATDDTKTRRGEEAQLVAEITGIAVTV